MIEHIGQEIIGNDGRNSFIIYKDVTETNIEYYYSVVDNKTGQIVSMNLISKPLFKLFKVAINDANMRGFKI